MRRQRFPVGPAPRTLRATALRAVPILALLTLPACLPSSTLGQPAYCDPDVFAKHELRLSSTDSARLVRLRAFELGRTVVAGLAVGSSDTDALVAFAGRHLAGPNTEGHCTWYLSRENASAARAFNVRELPYPVGSGDWPAVYMDLLGSSFASGPESFLACAQERSFIAVGCDGMQHRGPTVFGMLLAFSGCRPESAARIANGLWGLNGISAEVRLAIIRAAYDFGRAHPDQSGRLASLLSP